MFFGEFSVLKSPLITRRAFRLLIFSPQKEGEGFIRLSLV
ncbi:hypothetical protein LL3_02778 [Bacillus amyloliquefaciens LL3]|nr:hypothetical protein LL3_02778 [Bacillus amyloliquefaciens LL3]